MVLDGTYFILVQQELSHVSIDEEVVSLLMIHHLVVTHLHRIVDDFNNLYRIQYVKTSSSMNTFES